MTHTLAAAFGAAIVGIVLVAVLGAVERREKFAFVAGVGLFVGGTILAGGPSLSAAGGGIALVGILLIVASTVPLLREPPTTT